MSYLHRRFFPVASRFLMAGVLSLLMLGVSLCDNACGSYPITLDFAQNPTLPSAQGMTVVTGSGGPESTYSSILGNNRLKLDSFATGGDPEVYYSKTNFFATQGFNTVKYMGYAATNTYEFFINGNKVASGLRPKGFSGNEFYFGDGTPTGGNVSAEIEFVRYSNQPFSSGGEVPEPLSLAIWSLVAGGFVSCKRGKNRWQGARATWLSARSLRVSALFIPMLILTLSLTGCGDGRTGSSSKSSSQNSVPASKGPAGSQNQDSDKSYPVAEGPIE